ncbi:MAG: GtrA family protein, partial [bacterium]|nr:GtrA family protein [bacterium]
MSISVQGSAPLENANPAWSLRRILRPLFGPFMRYGIIGAGNTALDFGIYTALTRGWTFWRTHFLFANACSFVIVVTWSFYWNRRWAFENRERHRVTQYVRFVAATVVSLGIAEGVLATGVAFGVPDLVAKVIAGPLVVFWNFTAYRRWAFGARS